MPLIVLPPGPMSAPIFSGLILIVSIRGAYLLRSSARLVERVRHDAEDFGPRFFGARSCLRHDLVADAREFQVELETGDACLGAAKFEIHVAEMIFGADDVGQQVVAFQVAALRRFSVTRPTEMPATGVLIGTPASISASIPPQTLAIEVEPFDSITSLEMRIA